MSAHQPAPRPEELAGAGDLCRPWRRAIFALGLLCTALGIAGVILPLMPGTVFLLIALWAFSRSSERFHLWLYFHPRFGRGLRDWHRYRAIPLQAKMAAVAAMALSIAYVDLIAADNWEVPAWVTAALLPVAVWIVARPNPPKPVKSDLDAVGFRSMLAKVRSVRMDTVCVRLPHDASYKRQTRNSAPPANRLEDCGE